MESLLLVLAAIILIGPLFVLIPTVHDVDQRFRHRENESLGDHNRRDFPFYNLEKFRLDGSTVIPNRSKTDAD